MAELDTIEVNNPLSQDVDITYNGEKYTLAAESSQSYPQHLARHFAKYLSDKMMEGNVAALREKAMEKKPSQQEINALDLKGAQQLMMDTPERRMALYVILRDKNEVERVIKHYPQFKAQDAKLNFVGDMNVYDNFVTQFEAEQKAFQESLEVAETK